MDFEQLVLEMARLLFTRRIFKFQRDARALRQPPHRIHELNILDFLDEVEHVPALATAETMENLALRIDVEAWRLLLVKRAEGHEVHARTLERHIGADNVHDVAGGANLLARSG